MFDKETKHRAASWATVEPQSQRGGCRAVARLKEPKEEVDVLADANVSAELIHIGGCLADTRVTDYRKLAVGVRVVKGTVRDAVHDFLIPLRNSKGARKSR